MFATPHHTRWIVTGLLATTLLALAAPAFAERRRYKGVKAGSQRVVVRERSSSSAAPVLAGLIGGFILGTAVSSNAQPGVVYEDRYDDGPYHRPIQYSQPDYRYYDPYGDDWYESLDECRFSSGGPQIVFVIDVRSGHRVREMQFRHGRWNNCHDGYYASWANSRGHRWSERRGNQCDDDRRYSDRRGNRRDDDRRYRRDDDRRYRGDRDRDGDRDGDRRRSRGRDRDDD